MELVHSLDRIPEIGLDLKEVVSFDEVRELVSEPWIRFEDALEVTVRIERHGTAVSAVGRLKGRVIGVCSRCASELVCELDEPFAAIFTAEDDNDVKLGDGISGAGAGVHEWYPTHADTIDLAEPFRDALAFGLPDYPRCAEGQCDPGVERFLVREDEATSESKPKESVDPRLAKLIELRERMKNS